MNLPVAPADGFFLAGIAIWIGATVLSLLLFYWIIRLAVRHALRDAQAAPNGRGASQRDW